MDPRRVNFVTLIWWMMFRKLQVLLNHTQMPVNLNLTKKPWYWDWAWCGLIGMQLPTFLGLQTL